MAQMWITMGPQHPMTHGLWTLRVKVDGETVVDTEAELGYIHRGVEKIAEARDFTQVTPYCDRLCYVSAMTWANSYIYAAEDLLEVEVPERAEFIRLISAELQRLASHLMWLGAFGPDIGNLTLMTWCMRDREMFLDLLQELGGSRMHYNYPRIGGVKRDLPVGFADRARAKIKLFENRIDEYEMMLDESTIWLVRLQGVGYAVLKTWSMLVFQDQTFVLLVLIMTFAGHILTPFTTKLIGNLLSKSQPLSKEQTATTATVFEWKRCANPVRWFLMHLRRFPVEQIRTTTTVTR